MRRILCMIMTAVLSCMVARADTLGDAQQLMSQGSYEQAFTILKQYIAANPRAKDLGMAMYNAGMCAQNMAMDIEAEEYYRKSAARGVNVAWLQLGRLNSKRYDFSAAVADYAKYKDPDNLIMAERAKAERAAGFLDRVENVVIIDSITVPKDRFFEYYRLSKSAGTLAPSHLNEYPMFGNEDGTSWLTTSQDSTGRLLISRMDAMTTGGTQTYKYPELSERSNAAYPSMLSDGQTIYFASDGAESIGGWDIMITTYDQENGTFRNPQNIGMPYNSPFNDYMMVVDETNGVGWWATDRNTPQSDSVTIYMFIPSELRVNLPVDSPDLQSRAMIRDYRATWPDNADFTSLLQSIYEAPEEEEPPTEEFRFVVNGERVLTSWEQLPTLEGRKALTAYFDGMETVKDLEAELNGLYKQWSEGMRSDELKDYILRREAELDRARNALPDLRNEVYKNL